MFGWQLLLTVSVCLVADTALAGRKHNVLFIVSDNYRPDMGAYGIEDIYTPRMDALAKSGVIFSRAYCQLAWCSPSRNSFLSGRRPDVTQAWNFEVSFRDAPGAQSWISLPEYFKTNGYFAASSGKVFHPDLPVNFDFPRSWSVQPVLQNKWECKNGDNTTNMSCSFEQNVTAKEIDADAETATLLLQWLHNHTEQQPQIPFFLAAGFQSNRLPWSYPADTGRRYNVSSIKVTSHKNSLEETNELEWFRPTEIDWYADVADAGVVDHNHAMPTALQKQVRLAYYAAATHIDAQVGRLLDGLIDSGTDNDTVVVLTADHGQNLGERNMWSMMNLLETSLRVPLLIRPAPSANMRVVPVYHHPVELLDLYPTMAGLAGLPPPDKAWGLPGTNLVPGMKNDAAVKPLNAAFGQVTRCRNCTLSYGTNEYKDGCDADKVDAKNWTVACAHTPATKFDFMGMTVRTSDWRYALWCQWTPQLKANWSNCFFPELYNHTRDTALYDVENNGEYENLAGTPAVSGIEKDMYLLLRKAF
eukprot:m.9381 g.9381  ORF g.9381 m.9381 type:complete len:530 (-) comp4056_c0_seq2:699-2288(-)